tara:strand:- start:161 stop:316 length:156 start_codon:yes stop_codon:yes gene_type:complete
MKSDKNNPELKEGLHEYLEQMKAKREINRKRDEEAADEAYWNAPLDLKDRD